ncbi:MAG: hypothetical protein ABI443_06425 [Chthoniobacterales bacterium]
MKLLSFLLKVGLYVVLTFVLVVVFQYGIADTPSHLVSELTSLKAEVTTAVSSH